MLSTKRKTVFISGSAYEYGRLGDEGKTFVRDLTRTLVKNDFKVISGFGAGVGNHMLEGALHEIYLEKKGRLSDHLGVFPFPGRINGGADLMETIWDKYRNDIIAQAGIAIFLFGNKLEDICVREADGMVREFEIARSHGALLIPVGASGYIAEKLWKQVLGKYDDYFESREKFELYEQLGDPGVEPACLIDIILRIAL